MFSLFVHSAPRSTFIQCLWRKTALYSPCRHFVHIHPYFSRLLQPEGAFICVSFAPPEERLELLEYWDIDQPAKCLAWDVHVDAIGELNYPRFSL